MVVFFGTGMQLEKSCNVGESGSVKEESVEKFDFHMNSTDGSTRDSSTKGLASPSIVGSSKTSAKRSRCVRGFCLLAHLNC